MFGSLLINALTVLGYTRPVNHLCSQHPVKLVVFAYCMKLLSDTYKDNQIASRIETTVKGITTGWQSIHHALFRPTEFSADGDNLMNIRLGENAVLDNILFALPFVTMLVKVLQEHPLLSVSDPAVATEQEFLHKVIFDLCNFLLAQLLNDYDIESFSDVSIFLLDNGASTIHETFATKPLHEWFNAETSTARGSYFSYIGGWDALRGLLFFLFTRLQWFQQYLADPHEVQLYWIYFERNKSFVDI